MTKAVNDATLKQAGTIFQYLIALRDCFELNDDDILQIETNGDVSIINNTGGIFQKEVKHHFGAVSLSERDVDFWKTLANWYEDYERVKIFSNFILSTTAKILKNSPFYGWNDLDANEKLTRLKRVEEQTNNREKTFRSQCDRIFNEFYDEQKLLSILRKFTIEAEKNSLPGISNEFSKYIGHIPPKNRDHYIGALLGQILIKVKEPPHKWEVTKKDFEQILQIQTVAHIVDRKVPLPQEYAKVNIPPKVSEELAQKWFVEAIRQIEYKKEIPNAISDYWKTMATLINWFKDDQMCMNSLDEYMEGLEVKMGYAKDNREMDAIGADTEDIIKISRKLYNDVMQWDVKDFGSITCNQGFFQRGIIHNIVDEREFKWKVGEDIDEYKEY